MALSDAREVAQGHQPNGPLYTAVAHELRVACGRLDELANVFAADEWLAIQYLEQLQAFDLISQQIHESARLLDRLAGGQGHDDVIALVRLTEVQQRLQAALNSNCEVGHE